MKILQSVFEKKANDYVITSIENLNDRIKLIIFSDGSSVEVGKKDGIIQISSVNSYNDDDEMSKVFLDDIETTTNLKARSENLKEIINGKY